MSAKTETVRARIDPQLKQAVQKILDKLGISQTEAINMFYSQIELNQGLPFEVKIPNRQTKKAIEDAEKGINMKHFKNVDDLFKDLRI